MRLLFLIALGYILYRVIRGRVSPRPEMKNGRPAGEIEDDMVQDPQCGLWLTKRAAVLLKKDGSVHYFCSEECRDRFLESPGRN